MSKPTLKPAFTTITDADWKRELVAARLRRNPLSDEMRRRAQALPLGPVLDVLPPGEKFPRVL